MENIIIDGELLIAALTNKIYGLEYYLHKKTGNIIKIFTDCFSDKYDDLNDHVRQNKTDYESIKPVSTIIQYASMQRFVDSLEESVAKNELQDALRKYGPFQNFTSKIVEYPILQQKWYRFFYDELKIYGKKWLASHFKNMQIIHPLFEVA